LIGIPEHFFIALTVNILVKHSRSGLPPKVLYKLLYLHYITRQMMLFG